MIEKFINYINNKNKEYIIFDIGSRDCEQSIEFYKTFPNAKIYAFECNPNTLDLCEKNIIPYQDRITLIKGAVCDYDGFIKFYPINKEKTITTWEDGNQGASSLFKSNGKYTVETYIQDEITTNCHRLDTIMNKYSIPRVDIIWMDLQGAELLALKGLGSMLSTVEYINTEACHKEIYTGQVMYEELNNFLTNFFSFELLNNINLSTYFEDIIYKNKFIKDPIYKNINLTTQQQTYERGKPKDYLLHTIKLFNKYTDGKTILEIGSSRSVMNHSIEKFNPACCNDGHATYFFKHYTSARIFSVDIDPKCKKMIDSESRLSGVNAITKCGFEYADEIDYKIDLLYLDAWDVEPGTLYAESHLKIYNKLKDKLSNNCFVLIDDTDVGNGGKGKLVIPQLIKEGFLMIFNRRQTLFYRNMLVNKNKKYIEDYSYIKKNIKPPPFIVSNKYDLTYYKYDKYSQRGHDGIIEKIMEELDIKKGFFIEFGGWDGIYLSNCRNLFEKGWNGCFIEADKKKYLELVENYRNSDVICLNKYVYPELLEGNTVDSLYKEYMNNIEVDVLSIDIDGRDYEILEHLNLRPKLIIIEGGFLFHPCLRCKIPFNIAKNNVQQPLYELFELAEKKNYVPICFNQDTFLLRKDLYETHTFFQQINNDCVSLWSSAFFNVFSEEDRLYLQKYRKNNSIVNQYEHKYYLDIEHSLYNVFDIVIPVGPKDKSIIEEQIKYTKKNIIGYRNIYLICYDPSIMINGCITINENIFPFNIDTVAEYHGKSERNGWYLQQLLKLYSGKIIPNILDRYLVIDSDTFFLKPTTFVENNKSLYNYGKENHKQYFDHMKRLDENLTKNDEGKSGICHHMIFEKKYIDEIISKIEKIHNDLFYNIFLKEVTDKTSSGASEYEIYFNYMLKYNPDKIKIRKLKWKDTKFLENNNVFDYISCHWHLK